jgi:transposase
MKHQEINRPQDEIALERYKLISPILSAMEENADKGKIGAMKSEVCGLAGVSRKTLSRWLVRYAENGFNGLRYAPNTTSLKKRVIPDELVKEAILLRMEVPSRSIPQIIEILEMEEKAPQGLLKRSTLQDRLREEGYSKTQMKLYQKPGIAARRFARTERNDMWQANIKYSGYLNISGKSQEIFLSGLLMMQRATSSTVSFTQTAPKLLSKIVYVRQSSRKGCPCGFSLTTARSSVINGWNVPVLFWASSSFLPHLGSTIVYKRE